MRQCGLFIVITMLQTPGHRRSEDCAETGRTPTPRSGFTLIEMIVVLAIIAVVALMILPNIIGRPDQARVTVARTDLRTISAALKVYRLDNGDYPTTGQGLAALVDRPTTPPVANNWSEEGYLPEVPVDPWGAAYVYESPGRGRAFDLMSLGKDGKVGGDGLAADLVAER